MPFLLYVDEDIQSRALLTAVRALGIDVLSAGEAGMNGRSDPEQLAFARAEGRVLYSANRGDFANLHVGMVQRGESHGGIVLLHDRRVGVGEQSRRLLSIQQLRYEQMANRLEWLSSW